MPADRLGMPPTNRGHPRTGATHEQGPPMSRHDLGQLPPLLRDDPGGGPTAGQTRLTRQRQSRADANHAPGHTTLPSRHGTA